VCVRSKSRRGNGRLYTPRSSGVEASMDDEYILSSTRSSWALNVQ